MGFFGKLKDNFTHGVKVNLTAPSSASKTDPKIDIQIVISNEGKQTRTIKSYTIKFYAREQHNINDNSASSHRREKTFHEAKFDQVFTLAPGQSQQISYQIPLNQNNNIDNAGINQLANAVQGLLGGGWDKNWEYYLQCSADVDGITIDPSDNDRISLNDFGEWSKTINI